MKFIVILVFLLEAALGFGAGGRTASSKPRATGISARKSSEPVTPSITFVTLTDGAPIQSDGSGEGVLRLGTVSNVETHANGVSIQPSRDSFTVLTAVGVKVDLPGYNRLQSATISACILGHDSLKTIWLDGVRLSATPSIISRRAYYGIVSQHALKIVVPDSMAPGQLMDLIEILVTPN